MIHRRVRVDLHQAERGRRGLHSVDVRGRVHPLQGRTVDDRGKMTCELLQQAGLEQLIVDRGHTGGAFRMACAHVVANTIGVMDKGGCHGVRAADRER